MGEVAVIVALLLTCLVALVLVLLARREAAATRKRADEDATEVREEAAALRAEARERLAAASEREQATEAREREVRADRREVKAQREAVAARLEAAEALQAEAAAAAEAARERAAGILREARAEAAEIIDHASGVSGEEALAIQVRQATERAEHAAASLVRRIEDRARTTAEARARSILTTAVQRLAVPTSAQSTVTLVTLPSEELKGRIIGKEGRNIRTFEALTGVNVIVDDAVDTVTLSGFDVERREIAQVALEALIADGRIHPQRIEIAYREALEGAGARSTAAGLEAAEQAGVLGLDPEVVEVLGRLRLRTSYGQNVLAHLVETAQVAAALAAEVGADVETVRRAAFLHDVGKALTAELGGTHALVGADLLRRVGEPDVVVNAVAAHHDEVPALGVEAVLVQAADACSAARPGARRDELDQYIERMETLESLVAEHPGVRRALAMSAGREVRVVVEPAEVTDAQLPDLARTIAQHIERDLSFPGEITVTVVRELRASATAG